MLTNCMFTLKAGAAVPIHKKLTSVEGGKGEARDVLYSKACKDAVG